MGSPSAADAARVTTTLGRIRGASHDGIDRFLGIPFAKSPTGRLRFAAPEPPDQWTHELAAEQFGATAPQSPYSGPLGELLQVPSIAGDNILTLNVWAPAQASGAPVVLWFHGGALERGASAQSSYDGSTFARDGVVFVSANYRLGIEGFSVLEGVPLNLGLRDAALALEWVHREIEAFGGDPARITLMGESAGGALVAALLTQPHARSLVAGAIIQSGPLEAASREEGAHASVAVAKRLGIPATREAFAAVLPEELIRTRAELAAGSSPLRGIPGFKLVLDAESLPESPSEALALTDIPILIGSNTDEYRLWFTPEALSEIGRVKAGLARLAMRVSRRTNRALRSAHPQATPGELLGQLITDRLLRAPATAAVLARSVPSYMYEFAWQSPVRDLRAAHALEIAFAFDLLDDEDSLRLNGPNAPHELARDMHAAWVAFIRGGHPGWPAFVPGRLTQVWAETSETVPQRRADVIDSLR